MNYNITNDSSDATRINENVTPLSDNAYDIGTSSLRWESLYLGTQCKVSSTTNQLQLGITNTTTLTSPAPTASRTYTIPDCGADCSFAMTGGVQTFTNTTDSTSTSTGAIITSGGIGVAKNLSIGSNINIPAPNSTLTTGVYKVNGKTFLHSYDPAGTNGNVFLGTDSGSNTANMTAGTANIGIGKSSLKALTTGTSNVCIGGAAGLSLTTGNSNVCVGDALGTATTASNNTCVGSLSLTSGTTCSDNVMVGLTSGLFITSGSSNVGVGVLALGSIDTGTNNVAIGNSAGYVLTGSDSNNILIGNQGTSGDSGVIRIGVLGTHTTGVIPGAISMGNSSNTTEGIKLNCSVTSYVPSLLNYYEETTASLTAGGAFTTNGGTLDIVITRVGRMVNIVIPSKTVFNASSTATGSYSSLPVRFRPTQTISSIAVVYPNGTATTGIINVDSTGGLTFATSVSFGTWTDTQSVQWNSLTLTYNTS